MISFIFIEIPVRGNVEKTLKILATAVGCFCDDEMVSNLNAFLLYHETSEKYDTNPCTITVKNGTNREWLVYETYIVQPVCVVHLSRRPFARRGHDW